MPCHLLLDVWQCQWCQLRLGRQQNCRRRLTSMQKR
jgi:hypothetical protein